MKYKTYGLDENQIYFITEIMQEIYTLELIFQDMRRNELNINYNDTKFIIPNLNSLNSKLDLLFTFGEEIKNKLHYMCIREAIKTLKNNSQNIDKLLQNSIKIIAECI